MRTWLLTTLTVVGLIGLGVTALADVPTIPDADVGIGWSSSGVSAQLAETLPLLGVDRVHRELNVRGDGVGVFVVDDFGPVARPATGHGRAVLEAIRAVAPRVSLAWCDVDFGPVAEAVIADIAECFRWLVTHPEILADTTIINLSFRSGAFRYHEPCAFPERADTAWMRKLVDDKLVVAASGNSGWPDSLPFPACHPDILSVGASYDTDGDWVAYEAQGGFPGCAEPRRRDRLTCYTSRAPFLDLVAPGTTVSTPSAPTFSGTSAASPIVAGVAALMASADLNLAPNQIRRTLMETADRAWDPLNSRYVPRVDAFRAVSAVLPSSGEGGLLERYDGNRNRRIDQAELLALIDDWIAGEVDTEVLMEAVDAWIRQSTIAAQRPSATLVLHLTSIRVFTLDGRFVARSACGPHDSVGAAALLRQSGASTGSYAVVERDCHTGRTQRSLIAIHDGR